MRTRCSLCNFPNFRTAVLSMEQRSRTQRSYKYNIDIHFLDLTSSRVNHNNVFECLLSQHLRVDHVNRLFVLLINGSLGVCSYVNKLSGKLMAFVLQIFRYRYMDPAYTAQCQSFAYSIKMSKRMYNLICNLTDIKSILSFTCKNHLTVYISQFLYNIGYSHRNDAIKCADVVSVVCKSTYITNNQRNERVVTPCGHEGVSLSSHLSPCDHERYNPFKTLGYRR